MGTWKQYLKVIDTKGRDAGWDYARKNFAKGSTDYSAAQRFHAPTAAQRRESAKRQAEIGKVSGAEIARHCQLDFIRVTT